MLFNEIVFENAPEFFQPAYAAYKKGNYREAVKALEGTPEYLYSNYLRGMSILKDLNNHGNEDILQQAITFLDQFKTQSKEVYADIEDALGLAYYYLGILYKQKGLEQKAFEKAEHARSYFNNAIKNQPNFSSPWHNLGLLESNLDNLEGETSIHKQALQALENINDPENKAKVLHSLANAHNEVGEKYFYGNQFEQALVEVNLAENYYADCLALITSCPGNLTEVFNQDRMENFNRRGHIYYKLEQYEHAKQNYLQALSLNEKNIVTLNQLGMSAFKSGNFAEAIHYFNCYILNARVQDKMEGAQEEVDGWLNRTEALNKSGKYLAAEDAANIGLSMLPAEHEDRAAFAKELSFAKDAKQSKAACTIQKFFKKHQSASVQSDNESRDITSLGNDLKKCTL